MAVWLPGTIILLAFRRGMRAPYIYEAHMKPSFNLLIPGLPGCSVAAKDEGPTAYYLLPTAYCLPSQLAK